MLSIASGMAKMAEDFYTSLGITSSAPYVLECRCSAAARPEGRLSCERAGTDERLRIKMCIKAKEEDLITIDHELGHVYY